MKTIVVGFEDEQGRGEPAVIHGPEVPDAEQWKTFLDAKREHIFPEGMKRLEIARVESFETAIFVSATAGQERSDYLKAQADAIAKREAEKQAKLDAAKALVKAREDQSKANVTRAAANSKLTTAKARHADAKLDHEKSETKTSGLRLEKEAKLLETAQSEFDAADKAWAEAKDKLTK